MSWWISLSNSICYRINFIDSLRQPSLEYGKENLSLLQKILICSECPGILLFYVTFMPCLWLCTSVVAFLLLLMLVLLLAVVLLVPSRKMHWFSLQRSEHDWWTRLRPNDTLCKKRDSCQKFSHALLQKKKKNHRWFPPIWQPTEGFGCKYKN